jgi:RNA polymerase sigma-70 factor (ECF subfamily)
MIMGDRPTSPQAQGVLAVFLACRSTLARLVGRIVNRHDVDDILQEAYVRSCEAAEKTAIRSPHAFLLKASTHLALNHISRAGNKPATRIEDLSPSGVYRELAAESPQAQLDASQRFVVFCRAVGSLPGQCRRAFILKKIYGLSQQEIAADLGISASTVEKHIAKGLLMCRQYMDAVDRERRTLS